MPSLSAGTGHSVQLAGGEGRQGSLCAAQHRHILKAPDLERKSTSGARKYGIVAQRVLQTQIWLNGGPDPEVDQRQPGFYCCFYGLPVSNGRKVGYKEFVVVVVVWIETKKQTTFPRAGMEGVQGNGRPQ